MPFKVLMNKNGTATIILLSKSTKKLILLVRANGSNIMTYNIDQTLTIPLTFGDGTYYFSIFQEKSAHNFNKLATTISKVYHALETNEYQLSPNSFVPFDQLSSFYDLAKKLKTVEKIENYISKNFVYDYIGAIIRAKQLLTPPNLEQVFENKKGICLDLASLETAMCRICKIPAILVTGETNRGIHAWVKINDEIHDPTKIIQHNNKKLIYTEKYCY